MALDWPALLAQYRSELLERVVPFWCNYGIDWKNGGICTCISDEGQVLSEDKYMWSQLRALWTFSTLYNRIEQRSEWLDIAKQIYDFVTRYGRDADGNWVFVLSKEGRPLQGANSIYTDAFAMSGFTEFAKATGNQQAVDLARQTFVNVRRRLAIPGSYQTAPHPIPEGMRAHGIAMIFALTFDELGRFAGDPAIVQAGRDYADDIMTVFLQPERQRLYEFVNLDNTLRDVPPGRTVVPGHALESMWFMIHIYRQTGDTERIRQALEAIRWHIEYGWDPEFGGIVQARDAQGSRWERIADCKIWWPQTEALYALLLAYTLSGEQWCLDWFQRVNDYAFSHYPVPGYGEWIQNLDRQGRKLDSAVALPVKDPYHLARSLIQNIGLLEQLAHGQSTNRTQ